MSLTIDQDDWVVIKDGEGQRTLVTDDLDAVFLGTLMPHEAPAATARYATLKIETCRKGILRSIQMSTIGWIAMRTSDDTKQVLQEVYLVRS